MSKENVNLRFGALPYNWKLSLDCGHCIIPLSEYEEARAWIDESKCEDGFLYAPLAYGVQEDRRRKLNSEKPANLFRIPATHDIQLSSYCKDVDPRNTDAGFLVHFLGCLLGVRLQFEEWWVDLRIPTNVTRSFHLQADTAQHVLNHAYSKWFTWSEVEQRWFTNLLYMHNRVVGYRWNWERFAFEYMVFDGLFKFARNLFSFGKIPHSQRIDHMCEIFGLTVNPITTQIASARNELFHEALWAGSQPCTANDGEIYLFDGHLHRLNSRLFLAIIGYVNTYVKSAWWTFSSSLFDRIKDPMSSL